MSDTAPATARQAVSSLEVPRLLPERHDSSRLRTLSASSLRLLERCPERFRRRYLCGEREPAGGAMLVGKAVGQTVTAYYAAGIQDGTRLSEAEADDVLVAGFDEGELATEFRDDEPGELREGARSALRAYLSLPHEDCRRRAQRRPRHPPARTAHP
jgi:hypothetical protein